MTSEDVQLGEANALPPTADFPIAPDHGGPTSRGRGSGSTIAAILLLCGLVVAGCGGEGAAARPVHHRLSIQATIARFVATLRAGESSSYVATYLTGGSSPGTVIYAAGPGSEISFTDTPTAGGAPYRIIVNRSGELLCSIAPGRPGSWSCQTVGGGVATVKSRLYGFYSPTHWITFLQDFSRAASLPGDQAALSTRKEHGIDLQCVEVQGVGVPGVSTVCSTKRGVPGYVSVATNPNTFAIEHLVLSSSPSSFAAPSVTAP